MGKGKKKHRMRKYYFTCLILTTIISLTNCNDFKPKTSNKFHVISDQNKYYSDSSEVIKDDYGKPIPPPPPPPEIKWFTDIVFIFDSNDYVHIYQTKLTENNTKNEYFKPTYPFFIELNPNQLVTIKSNYFIDFIKDNNDIFMLDSLKHNYSRIFMAASPTDTIKNPAFYDLLNMIKFKNFGRRQVLYISRLTTEEENYVINCKLKKIEFEPERHVWKGKYLDGKCEPYTKEYQLLEKQCYFVRKAINIFDPECTKLERIL